MSRRNKPRPTQQRGAPAPLAAGEEAICLRLEAAADKCREDCTHWLALYVSTHQQPPGLILMILPAPEPPTAQPLQREAVLDMARALGLHAAVAALGPMSPILVLGEGRAVLLGSAVGASFSPSLINSPAPGGLSS